MGMLCVCVCVASHLNARAELLTSFIVAKAAAAAAADFAYMQLPIFCSPRNISIFGKTSARTFASPMRCLYLPV